MPSIARYRNLRFNIINEPFIILMRCTYRPNYFKKTIFSILNQSYQNFKIIMCYDDDNCLDYLEEYRNHEKITIFKSKEVDKTSEGFYNLYCNQLLEYVTEGWILFMDDDNIYASQDSLLEIRNNLQDKNDFLVWKFKTGQCIARPKDINYIKPYTIDAGSFCFYHEFKNLSSWDDKRGGDFRFVDKLLENKKDFNRKFINKLLLQTQHRNHFGLKGKKEEYIKKKEEENNIQTEKKIIKEEIINKVSQDRILTLEELLDEFNITSFYISESLKQFKDRLLEKFKLYKNLEESQSILFFGIYSPRDIQQIKKFNDKNIFLICGGSDVPNIKKINNFSNIKIIAISKNVEKRIKDMNYSCQLINFDLLNKDLFYPRESTDNYIYIYDGYSDKNPNNKFYYGEEYFKEVVKRLPNEKFLYSSKLHAKYEDMPNIYAKCKIGLRLTNNDGNANTVQEFKAMNIPIVHNQSDYGLKWKTVDDIIEYIMMIKNQKKGTEIIIISENSWNVGGFGSRAYKVYQQIKINKTDTKLLYIDHNQEDSIQVNKYNPNIYSMLLGNFKEYYKFLLNHVQNYKNTNNVLNKCKKYYNDFIGDNTKIICITPYLLYLINYLYPNNEILYYCGHIDIKNYNINNFIMTDRFKDIINKDNVTLWGNSHLPKLFFNTFTNKNVDIVYCISENKDNSEYKKIYDIAFITTNLNRLDKNFTLFNEICKQMPYLKKILIGKKENNVINYENCIHYNEVTNSHVNDILKQTKILLIPSKKDCAPNTFIEAIYNKCIPFISTNTGFNMIANKKYKYVYKCDDLESWINNINNIINNYNESSFDLNYFSNILLEFNKSQNIVNKYIDNRYMNNPTEKIITLVVYNKQNNVYHNQYLKSSFRNTIIINNYEEFCKIQFNDNFIILIDDSIILYNWITYDTRNKLLLSNCMEDKINCCNINYSSDLAYIFKSKHISLMKEYFNISKEEFKYNILRTNPNILDNTYFVNINNIITKNNFKIGILFLQQFKNSIFEVYVKKVIEYYGEDNVIIYLFYGENTPFGPFENNLKNIIFVNEDNIENFIVVNYKIEILYIPYLPLAFIKDNTNFNKVMNNSTFKKYILILGAISHMTEYIDKYNIDGVMSKGISDDLKKKHNNIMTTWYQPDIFKLKKYSITERDHLNKNFCFIGRFVFEKNLMFLIEGFHLFLEKTNYTYKLYLIGSGADEYKMKQYINSHNLSENIIIINWMSHNELYSFLNKDIDYNISTSITEGISAVIQECMIIGIPSIISNIWNNRDTIIDNYNGLKFNFNNYDEFMLSNPSRKEIYINFNKYDDRVNFVNVLISTIDNIQLYNKLSNNCKKFIEDNKNKINNIDYESFFT